MWFTLWIFGAAFTMEMVRAGVDIGEPPPVIRELRRRPRFHQEVIIALTAIAITVVWPWIIIAAITSVALKRR
jgi:hypothetical protein